MAIGTNGAVRLALVDDYEVVLVGLAHMFDDYADRVEVVEVDARSPVTVDVDIALYDTFAQGEADSTDLLVLLANPHARHVVVYTWAFDPELIEAALERGASGYLSKALTARELVDALERIDQGEIVVSPAVSRRVAGSSDWPGRRDGLTERESEVLALITQGRSNAEIATLTHLSINSVKFHIRNIYRKIRVSTRPHAVLWGVDHGFKVDLHRVDRWRQG
jgi:DNA-binding NarL/FixJ family response regulator